MAFSFIARMFEISFCCDSNALFSCRITLAYSSLSQTEPVVRCLMLAASLVEKSLKLLQRLALVRLSCQVSHDRLEKMSVFDGKVCRVKDLFLGGWLFYSLGK